ncbi:MAG: helix-turn-helix domain-containing protein [Ruminococcaceae bacterium]|nr:helix-turn-helix domain-containing protein [Oscillospiraceae bacterium]
MNIKLADRLVELRKEHKLSQEALAEKLGLSRQSISKWERAEASPDTDNLIALAEVYGITLDELLGNNEPKAEKSEPQPTKKQLSAKQIKGKSNLKKAPLLFLGAIAVYVGGGIILGVFWWALMWILFPLVLGYTFSALSLCFEDRKLLSIIFSTVAAIFLAVSLYIALGVTFGLWGLAWIIFLAIPAYVYVKVIKK